ncbi:MAG: hypothetical protein A2Y53_03945 [Chloroflexi bacterium RBG_16_47_49]|nr:MAG: hypothetical protein A2Y53_03945 [Chloroflexi bacterium RBG_16_47_49]
MRRLRIPPPDLHKEEKTYLDADYSSGTALTVINAIGFAGGEVTFFTVVGEPAEDKTELQTVASLTGSTVINISSALRFAHNKSTPVYRSPWDQIEIYKMPSGGGWSLISTSNIQWDKRETLYIDDDGGNTDSYRFRFKNSASTIYSEYSPTVTGAGFARNQVGYMVERIRKNVNDPERKIISDEEIIQFLDTAQDLIKGVRQDWWFLLVDTFKQLDGIAVTAGEGVYSLASYTDFNFLESVRYNFNDGTDDILRHLRAEDALIFDDRVRDQDRDEDDQIEVYKLLPPDSSSDNGYIQVDPVPENANGTLYPNYYKIMTTLDDVADETPIPIPSILELYAMSQCERIKGNETKATLYENLFFGKSGQGNLSSRIVIRPTGIQLLERMQNSYLHPQGQPRSWKVWRGRKAIKELMQDTSHGLGNDSLREKYFDFPRR